MISNPLISPMSENKYDRKRHQNIEPGNNKRHKSEEEDDGFNIFREKGHDENSISAIKLRFELFPKSELKDQVEASDKLVNFYKTIVDNLIEIKLLGCASLEEYKQIKNLVTELKKIDMENLSDINLDIDGFSKKHISEDINIVILEYQRRLNGENRENTDIRAGKRTAEYFRREAPKEKD